MRKINASLFTSLDGVVEAPEQWTGPYFSPQVGQTVGDLMASADTLLLGRVTYQTFATAFAHDTSGNPLATQMNEFPKVVVSSTLEKTDWQNSALITGDIGEQICNLKAQAGRNINVSGSTTLVRWLLKNGLLDQLDLLVFPVVVGKGTRLFDTECEQLALSLSRCEALDTGVIHLRFDTHRG
jgi:dihydrofolate reductase